MRVLTPRSSFLVRDGDALAGAADAGDCGALDAKVYLRIAVAGDYGPGELPAFGPDAPDGLLLAGARGRADVQQISGRLAVCEARSGRADGATKIVAVIDTPAGALAAAEYPGSSARLSGLVFDGAALAQRLGPGALAAARGAVLLAAAAGDLEAIDGPQPGEGADFAAACEAARAEGFCGKIALDAAQAQTIAAAFGTSPGGGASTNRHDPGHRSAR